jgi:hypothetical protein
MRRYKLYLVGGRVLEFEAKTARLEFTWSHLLGYTSGDLLVDGGAS